LDEDDGAQSHVKTRKRKHGSSSNSPKKSVKKSKSNSSRNPSQKKRGQDQDAEEGLELDEGQEVVGVVVQAPKTGRVPPGQISKNTFHFLSQLKRPECNDREWFKLQEPVYRLAEQEWKDFVDEFTTLLNEADPQIPHLPPKDVIHRIYRDVRFSNDKTPYKRGFSASFSRSGRKGIFAGYHIAIKPDGESIIAAGSWQPGRNELATIRSNLLRSSTRFRNVISTPPFVELFGEPKPPPKGQRRSIFGMEDELKVAPKGVEKTHKDIDLLKCRSFAVVHRFTDEQVLSPDFKHDLAGVAKVMRPFVHCINDLMTIQNADNSSSDSEGGDEEEDDDGDDVEE